MNFTLFSNFTKVKSTKIKLENNKLLANLVKDDEAENLTT